MNPVLSLNEMKAFSSYSEFLQYPIPVQPWSCDISRFFPLWDNSQQGGKIITFASRTLFYMILYLTVQVINFLIFRWF